MCTKLKRNYIGGTRTKKKKKLNTTALRHYPAFVSIPTMRALNANNSRGTPCLRQRSGVKMSVFQNFLCYRWDSLQWSRFTATCMCYLTAYACHAVVVTLQLTCVDTSSKLCLWKSKMRATQFFVPTVKREHERDKWKEWRMMRIWKKLYSYDSHRLHNQ